jgi:pimeloyl-ACP methyl ester carboxylesterase
LQEEANAPEQSMSIAAAFSNFDPASAPIVGIEKVIGGIPVIVYGLKSISIPDSALCPSDQRHCNVVVCLHGRQGNAQDVTRLCQALCNASENATVAIAFDMRNHGHRTYSPVSNSSWATKSGSVANFNHAPDMYAIQYVRSPIPILIGWILH